LGEGDTINVRKRRTTMDKSTPKRIADAKKAIKRMDKVEKLNSYYDIYSTAWAALKCGLNKRFPEEARWDRVAEAYIMLIPTDMFTGILRRAMEDKEWEQVEFVYKELKEYAALSKHSNRGPENPQNYREREVR
jgi:hypothetical protein